jgi:hypothetical protein
MTYAFGERVTVYREIRDRFGTVTRTDEQTVDGVAVAPRTSSETGADMRSAVVRSGLTMFLPDETVRLTAAHRVIREDGTEWRVQGLPAVWANPLTGWTPGVQVEIDRVTG